MGVTLIDLKPLTLMIFCNIQFSRRPPNIFLIFALLWWVMLLMSFVTFALSKTGLSWIIGDSVS